MMFDARDNGQPGQFGCKWGDNGWEFDGGDWMAYKVAQWRSRYYLPAVNWISAKMSPGILSYNKWTEKREFPAWPRVCSRCWTINPNVDDWPSMTQYHWDKDKQKNDPNYVGYLCLGCSDEYSSYWKERWDEHNQMIYEGLRG